MDFIKIAKVDNVRLEKGHQVHLGTLHLTAHQLIFNHPEQELWISYPIIYTVERRAPTSDGYHPLNFKCRNFLFVTFLVEKEQDAVDVFESVQKLTCIESITQLYAFFYQPFPKFVVDDGWSIYNPVEEYQRLGVGTKTNHWRFTSLNQEYQLCSTYPRILAVPSKISDTVVSYAAKYRSKNRIPVLSYIHSSNMATISRSSQPMVGLKQARSVQDEKLVEAIFLSNTPQSPNTPSPTTTNLIVDARPTANAMANVAIGAGSENMEHYKNCKKLYLGIDNIHVMRDSLNKVIEAIQSTDTSGIVTKIQLSKTNWLKHIGSILEGAAVIVNNIAQSNSHVLVHCSDGWDRTSQLTSLAELCLDPFYRTIRGFEVLVEKEWISFGHKFTERCGHLANEKSFLVNTTTNAAASTFNNVHHRYFKQNQGRYSSPVFHQFLDCVYQIWTQNPTRFEFNERFLIQLHYHLYSCQFGTFLFNCEKERVEAQPDKTTYSVWSYFNSNPEDFQNQVFERERDEQNPVITPDTKYLKYWSGLFCRRDEEINEFPEVGMIEMSSDLS
ncbi:phosphatases II [Basidiobolus meristosporus CBS 931.73]|uniref:Phosphatases II n=1 Tax=Basidiobolus meristosporus CBS 931.73 TaxID=1314790 RepID=A0A1Y1YBM7_9FUNG|nr:phosphatases II [Basidiobolus meristosporus CBS 931.73]|eukprot:ORX95343.1 phosphatases II [Basidiobolus meristosporus CBS 931.73]